MKAAMAAGLAGR
jgi:hypothetical protein